MKRITALLLTLAICLTMCACSKEEKNPLVTTWKVGNESYEETFVFTQSNGQITGHSVYYHYTDETWGENDFTVKEQTEDHLIMLYDDGTMHSAIYRLYGDILWLDGVYYADTASETVTPETAAWYTVAFSMEYSTITLGQSVSEVNQALGTTLEIEETPWIYYDTSFYAMCPAYAEYNTRDGDVYAIGLGFDENSKLVNFTKQGDGEAALSKLVYLMMLPDEYTRTNRTDTEYTHETYTWNLFGYVMEFELVMNQDSSETIWYTQTWYVPQ